MVWIGVIVISLIVGFTGFVLGIAYGQEGGDWIVHSRRSSEEDK